MLQASLNDPFWGDGWNTIVSFWNGVFSGAFAVSFREAIAGINKKWDPF